MVQPGFTPTSAARVLLPTPVQLMAWRYQGTCWERPGASRLAWHASESLRTRCGLSGGCITYVGAIERDRMVYCRLQPSAACCGKLDHWERHCPGARAVKVCLVQQRAASFQVQEAGSTAGDSGQHEASRAWPQANRDGLCNTVWW